MHICLVYKQRNAETSDVDLAELYEQNYTNKKVKWVSDTAREVIDSI